MGISGLKLKLKINLKNQKFIKLHKIHLSTKNTSKKFKIA